MASRDLSAFSIESDHFLFGEQYKIAFGRCSSEEEIQDWVSHLKEKPWITQGQLDQFIERARAHHGLVPS